MSIMILQRLWWVARIPHGQAPGQPRRRAEVGRCCSCHLVWVRRHQEMSLALSASHSMISWWRLRVALGRGQFRCHGCGYCGMAGWDGSRAVDLREL
jgi:hypothetical protein